MLMAAAATTKQHVEEAGRRGPPPPLHMTSVPAGRPLPACLPGGGWPLPPSLLHLHHQQCCSLLWSVRTCCALITATP